MMYHRHLSVRPIRNKPKSPTWTSGAELYTSNFKIDTQLLVFKNHVISGIENWFQVFWQMFSGDLFVFLRYWWKWRSKQKCVFLEPWRRFYKLIQILPVLQQMFSGDLLWVQLCAMCNLTTSTKRTIYISADRPEEDIYNGRHKTALEGWLICWIAVVVFWQRCCVCNLD